MGKKYGFGSKNYLIHSRCLIYFCMDFDPQDFDPMQNFVPLIGFGVDPFLGFHRLFRHIMDFCASLLQSLKGEITGSCHCHSTLSFYFAFSRLVSEKTRVFCSVRGQPQ